VVSLILSPMENHFYHGPGGNGSPPGCNGGPGNGGPGGKGAPGGGSCCFTPETEVDIVDGQSASNASGP
jgi:hypothetical protein